MTDPITHGGAHGQNQFKDKDKAKRAFAERYGEDAVELDALEILRHRTLARLVRKVIALYRDTTLQARLLEVRSEARKRLSRHGLSSDACTAIIP